MRDSTTPATATLDGNQPTHAIVAAQTFIDISWEPGAVAVHLLPVMDGSFNSFVEDVQATLGLSGLDVAQVSHTLLMLGRT